MICVYCAFNKYKNNPRLEIKEIKDKCGNILESIDRVLSENQQHADILHNTLNDIKKNKQTEEQRVLQFYDKLIKFLEEKKVENIENIGMIFSQNAEKLSEKLDYFSTKMQDAEDLKANIIRVSNGDSTRINEIMMSYNQFIKENSDGSKLNLELIEYKYMHEDENKIFKYLNNSSDLKSKQKMIKFSSVTRNLNNQNKEGIKFLLKNFFFLFLLVAVKQSKRNNEMNFNNNQRSDLFNSDLLESSHYDEYEREDYGRYISSQSKQNQLKPFDSKERLKKDLMPNNYDSSI